MKSDEREEKESLRNIDALCLPGHPRRPVPGGGGTASKAVRALASDQRRGVACTRWENGSEKKRLYFCGGGRYGKQIEGRDKS
jgi:hypothetical protein